MKFHVIMASKTLQLQGSSLKKDPVWEVVVEAIGMDGMIRVWSEDRTFEGICQEDSI